MCVHAKAKNYLHGIGIGINPKLTQYFENSRRATVCFIGLIHIHARQVRTASSSTPHAPQVHSDCDPDNSLPAMASDTDKLSQCTQMPRVT